MYLIGKLCDPLLLCYIKFALIYAVCLDLAAQLSTCQLMQNQTLLSCIDNCLLFRDGSTATFADSYCDKIEIVHSAGVPGADAHSVSTVVSCARDTGGWDFSGDAGLRDAVMDHLPHSICKARAGLMPALVFLRRTVGGRGVCVAQTCTAARSAGKAAHVGTTLLTAAACQTHAVAAVQRGRCPVA